MIDHYFSVEVIGCGSCENFHRTLDKIKAGLRHVGDSSVGSVQYGPEKI